MLTEIGAIMIILESPSGTEGVTDQPIYVEDLAINPTGEFIERPGRGAFHGPEMTGIIGGRHGKCTFTTEMRTDGSQAFDAGLAILLQACNYVKTANVYTIAKIATQQTITIECWQDGLLKVLYGAAGTFTMEGETNGRVLFKFDFDGLYKAEDDETPVPGYVPTGNVIMFGDGAFTVLSESHMISKFTFDAGNVVVPRYDITGPGGILHYQTTYPKPTASWDPEADTVANDDMHADWLAGVTGTLSLSVADGTDRVTLDCGKVQYMEIPEGARDNIRIHEVNAQCLETHATVPTMAKFTVDADP